MQKFFVVAVFFVVIVGSYARSIAVLSNQEEGPVAVLLVEDENHGQLVRQKRQFGRGHGHRGGNRGHGGQGGGFGGGGGGGFGPGPQQNFGQPQFGQSSSQANANAFNQQQGPNGFGASAANAGAQSFNSQGPLGGFGASAANAQSQGFSAGPNGFNANAALSGSQTYNLPGNHHINLAYGGSYGNANGVGTSGNSHSITYD